MDKLGRMVYVTLTLCMKLGIQYLTQTLGPFECEGEAKTEGKTIVSRYSTHQPYLLAKFDSYPCFIWFLRFSKEERESWDPAVYLPFGMGPRNCIGMRFAQLVIKMALVSLLQRLTFVTCDETPVSSSEELHAKDICTVKFYFKLRFL